MPWGRRRMDRVDDHRIHVRFSTSASGRPVVLVHGFVISSRYMRPLGRQLASRFNVSAPDLPGFGLSSKPPEPLGVAGLARALARWMDVAGPGPAPLVGNSFGCQIIVELARQRPDLVPRAVLIGPTMDPGARPLAQVGRLLRDAPRENPLLWALHVPDYAHAGLKRAARTFRYAMQDPVRDKLPHVQAPTLVVRGSRDPIVSQAWAREVADTLPRGRLVVLPGGPHALNYSRPRQLARLITPFLEGDPNALP